MEYLVARIVDRDGATLSLRVSSATPFHVTEAGTLIIYGVEGAPTGSAVMAPGAWSGAWIEGDERAEGA